MTAKGYKCAFVLSDAAVLDVVQRSTHPQVYHLTVTEPTTRGLSLELITTLTTLYRSNRWELKVFEMEGYENDDPSKNFEGVANHGRTAGKLLPETVYFYVIDLGATDKDGNAVEEDNRYRKGFVYIRR